MTTNATNAEKQKSFNELVAKLPPEKIEAIMQLSQSPKYGEKQTLLGIWQTNGLPINYENPDRPGTTTSELMRKKEAAVFASVCRLVCRLHWNPEHPKGS